MSRGFVEVMVFQKMVLNKVSAEDQSLVKEIFHLQAEIGTTGAYPYLHGTGSGFLFWILFFSKYAGDSSALINAFEIALCISIPTWLLYKFHYGPKYRKLKEDFEKRTQNDSDFRRVRELIKTIGEEIQKENP